MFNRALFLRYFVPQFIGFTIAAFFIGLGWRGIAGAFLLSAVITSLAAIFAGGLATKVANRLYGTGRRPTSPAAQWREELDQVRQLKRTNQFSKALARIDRLLEDDPGSAEAIYLKAEILLEGYANRKGAKKCLREVLRLSGQDQVVHQWAFTKLDQLSRPELKE
jgi:tetratricopeptide (TPR) repeat protein